MKTDRIRKSAHAKTRMQQRSIPEIGIILLRDYGCQTNAPGNCSRYFFDRAAWREIKQLFGVWPLKKMEQLQKAYIIENEDGMIVTAGFDRRLAA